jgi:GxxExxY protein
VRFYTPHTARSAVHDRGHESRNQVAVVTAIDSQINRLTYLIIACAMKVHTALGPGLLESAYLACLIHELRQAGLQVETEVRVPLAYAGITLECGFRIDILVEGLVVVQPKRVEAVLPVHEAPQTPREARCTTAHERTESAAWANLCAASVYLRVPFLCALCELRGL